MLELPILTLVAFGALSTVGGKSLYWNTREMYNWLTALGDKEMN